MNAGRDSDGYGPPVDSEISLNISTCCDRTSLISVCVFAFELKCTQLQKEVCSVNFCLSLNEPQAKPIRGTSVSRVIIHRVPFTFGYFVRLV